MSVESLYILRRLLPALAAAALLAGLGTGCATSPPPARWPAFGEEYAFEIDRGPIFFLTFRDPDVLDWRRMAGVEIMRSGTAQRYRLVRLNAGMVLVTWRDPEGSTITFVTDTVSGEVTVTISRAEDPVLMHGRVRPASRLRGNTGADAGGS